MKIGLALSGGGILGMAHLGVLKEIQKNKVNVDIISGTSIGAMAGALYAAGGVTMIEKFLDSFIKQNPIPRKLFMLFNNNVMEVASKSLKECLGDVEFSDLKIKLICVATDLSTGQMVVLDKGKVADAVLASCAYPGIMPVHQLDGMFLIDGAMVCNLPAKILRKFGADFVIGSTLYEVKNINSKEELKHIIKNKDQLNLRALNIIFRSLSTADYKSCDFCFTHPVGEFNWLEIDHMPGAQNAGESHAKENFQAMLGKMELKKKELKKKSK